MGLETQENYNCCIKSLIRKTYTRVTLETVLLEGKLDKMGRMDRMDIVDEKCFSNDLILFVNRY